MVIFKPGYGRWRFQGYDQWRALNFWELDARIKAAWKQFEGEGVVIELPSIKTWKERLAFYDMLASAPDVPPEKRRRLAEAIKGERAYLGFRD